MASCKDDEYTEKADQQRDILEVTGPGGRWQMGAFCVLFFISVPGAGLNLGISFMAPDIDYWCARPAEAANMSVEEWKKLGLPSEDKRCSRYSNLTFPLTDEQNSTAVGLMDCESWEFDHSFYSTTILEKFSLVCDREWLMSFSKSIFMAGVLVAGAVFGYLSDRIGRKLTITISCWITFISSVIGVFASSITVFLLARFFTAIGVGGYYNILYVLLMEITGPDMRSFYGNLVQLGYSVGFVCLPGVVWLIRDSFWLHVALTLPYAIFLGVWWMITESPRWLLSKGRTAAAKEVLITASKLNGKNYPDINHTIDEILAITNKDNESTTEEGNIFGLMRIPGMCQMTLNVVFTWFVISFIYYGLSFNTNELAGDPFVNFAASGVVEFPAVGFSVLVTRHFGRKKPVVATMTAGGLICLASYFLPQDPTWPRSIFPVIGKFFVTSCFSMIHVFTMELFPTTVRGSVMGLATFFEVISSIISPFMRELGIATHPYVPFILFGGMATASGLFTLLLPETAGAKVPDTFQEAASVSRRKNDTLQMKKNHENKDSSTSRI